MQFDSLVFIAFLGICLGLYALPTSWRTKKTQLLVFSYLFYGAWNPPFVALLALSTVVDWSVAKRMARSRGTRRRALLGVSLVVNLGLLGYFKYGSLLLESFQLMVGAMGIDYRPPTWDIVLPVGISFYTFQTLSYTIDVYRGHMKPWTSFLDFGLFVSFFPQLVAGPILRASEFLPQCREPKRITSDQLGWGLSLLSLGLFEKVVLADGYFAPVADIIYDPIVQPGFVDAWLGSFAFAGQVFCDFAGYSTCALGVAWMFGFVVPRNFLFPYAAIGFQDFWRRWHISLSRWLRDYVYVPLGGNRSSRGRTLANLMITMLLAGAWHLAEWRFLAMGGLFGLYLIAERLLRERFPAGRWRATVYGRSGLMLLTFLLNCLAFVFFRSPTFGVAADRFSTMITAGPETSLLSSVLQGRTLVLTGAMLATHWWMRDRTLEGVASRTPAWARVLVLTTLWILLAMAPGDERAYIYFQF